MELLRRTSVTLSSYNKLSGSVSNAKFAFPSIITNSRARVFVTPTFFTVDRSWYSVDQDNNSFQVSKVAGDADDPDIVTLVFAPGNYNVFNFMALVICQLDAAFGQGAWCVTYDKVTAKFTFTPPDDGLTYYFRFANWLSAQMGFAECGPNTDHHSMTHAAPLVSEVPVAMVHEKLLLINSDLPFVPGSSLNNFTPSGAVHDGNVLLAVPLARCEQVGTLEWSKADSNISKWRLMEGVDFREINISFTDEFLKPILIQTSWVLSMDIDYYEVASTQKMMKELTTMREALDYLALKKMKGGRRPEGDTYNEYDDADATILD
jgi:hypothetical protein